MMPCNLGSGPGIGAMMQFAKTFLNRLRIFEQFLCFAAFLVIAGALIYDVLKREITGSGAFGAPQLAVIGMIVVSYIGIGLASAAGSHYRPHFADNIFPAKYEKLMERISEFGFAAFCAFVAAVATKVCLESYDLKDVAPVLRNPIWPVQLMIAIGFGFVAVRHFLYGLYPDIKPAGGGNAEVPSDEQVKEILHGNDAYDRERATKGERT
jgi:TRAP-type C4-dicarboxylate transport system permease small subunit